MNFFDKIPVSVYKVLIVIATVIWGYAFVGMKIGMDSVEANWLIGIRFVLAGLILSAIVFKELRREWSRGFVCNSLLLGFLEFLAFSTQTIGLKYTTPGVNAFLTAAYCVITPFIAWLVFRKKPSSKNFVAAFVALFGIWMVSVTCGTGLSMGLGEFLSFICAFFFAGHIVVMSKAAKKYSAIALSAAEFLCEGFFALVAGALFETPPSLSSFTPDFIGLLSFLVLGSTIFCFGIQNISLKYVPPSQASLLLSLECVFGVIFSVLLYGEVVTVRMAVGFALIFGAVILSEYEPKSKKGTNVSKENDLEP